MKRSAFLSTLIILVLPAAVCLAEIPKTINYQGMLTGEGDPITDTLDLEFGIYTQEAGGTPEWSEPHTQVPIIDGLFNVILGSVDPNGVDLDFSESYWLEVVVVDDTMPRIQFTSVGYAYRARWADTASYAEAGGAADNAWVRGTPDSVLYTIRLLGIAKGGANNMLYGTLRDTHVNLGVSCTTGTSGQDYSYATVSGGNRNIASRNYATVGGGFFNTAGGDRAAVGGGYYNTASGNYATVPGGRKNTADTTYATVGGGYYDTASGYCATVGGGSYNTSSGEYATLAGGWHNTASGNSATVAGGRDNTADTLYATVGGGYYDTASGYCATVEGGSYNTASGDYATVAGGSNNDAGGDYATVGGGRSNTASGNFSFAAGRRAKANHLGTFVWADSSVNTNFTSTGDNQFLIRAAGGVGIGTTDPSEKLDVNGTARLRGITEAVGDAEPVVVDDNGVLHKSSVSSKRYKDNIRELDVDPESVLGLETVRFEWKASGGQDVGLIAEDVQDLIPDLVRYDKEGRPNGVKYEKLSLYLLEAMKWLKAENQALKQRIEALEAR